VTALGLIPGALPSRAATQDLGHSTAPSQLPDGHPAQQAGVPPPGSPALPWPLPHALQIRDSSKNTLFQPS